MSVIIKIDYRWDLVGCDHEWCVNCLWKTDPHCEGKYQYNNLMDKAGAREVVDYDKPQAKCLPEVGGN